MTFCREIGGLGDIEGKVSVKLIFSSFSKNGYSSSGLVCAKTINFRAKLYRYQLNQNYISYNFGPYMSYPCDALFWR